MGEKRIGWERREEKRREEVGEDGREEDRMGEKRIGWEIRE